MHYKRFFSGFLILIFIFVSCAKDSKPLTGQSVTKKNLPEDLKKIEVKIKGMTCEIGCARLIESKLSKTKGVKFVDVIFEKNLGNIEYDANITDKNKIAKVIKNIGGGDLYEMVSSRDVKEFQVFIEK